MNAGQMKEAEEHNGKSLNALERLTRDYPDFPQYQRDRVNSQMKRARVLGHLGRWRDAEAGFRHAAELLEKLIADFPDVPFYQRDRVNSLTKLADVLANAGRHPEADKTYRAAADAARKLIGRFPGDADYRYLLSGNRHNHAILLDRRGAAEVRDAAKAYSEALDLLDQLAADDPAVPEYRRDQANSRLALAALLQKTGRSAEAVKLCRQAVDGIKVLVKEYPDMTEY